MPMRVLAGYCEAAAGPRCFVARLLAILSYVSMYVYVRCGCSQPAVANEASHFGLLATLLNTLLEFYSVRACDHPRRVRLRATISRAPHRVVIASCHVAGRRAGERLRDGFAACHHGTDATCANGSNRAPALRRAAAATGQSARLSAVVSARVRRRLFNGTRYRQARFGALR